MAKSVPTFAGKSFEVAYQGLVAINSYASDGASLRYEITEGDFRGATGEVSCTWQQIRDQTYAISWQEADGSTVVHVDDFKNGTSLTFFTTNALEFMRLEGTLHEIPDR